jgi:hypothetical protein
MMMHGKQNLMDALKESLGIRVQRPTHAEMLQDPHVKTLITRRTELAACARTLTTIEERYATSIVLRRVAGRERDLRLEAAQLALQAALEIIDAKVDGLQWDLDRLLEEAE